ncbi:MAG: hypothetical protein IPG31_02150 [Nitrosomonas sp.]|nr:hypothetical protein [Nitrosomonas sp.]
MLAGFPITPDISIIQAALYFGLKRNLNLKTKRLPIPMLALFFNKKQLQQFFIDEFPLKTALVSVLNPQPSHFYIALPSQDDIPLPSPEMALITGEMIPEEFDWQSWNILVYPWRSLYYS